MNKNIIHIILLIVAGLLLGSGPVYLKLRSERNEYRKEIANLNNRFALLQSKYSEEKARAAGLLRTKTTLEGETRALRADIERLEKEKEAFSTEQGNLVADCEKKKTVLEENVKHLTQQHTDLTAKHQELQAEHARKIKEYDGTVRELTANKNKLTHDLNAQTQKLDRCQTHNTQLVEITNELVEKYKNKGVLNSVVSNEPFTGIKQVEMEHLMQEYQDKIESHQLEPQKQ